MRCRAFVRWRKKTTKSGDPYLVPESHLYPDTVKGGGCPEGYVVCGGRIIARVYPYADPIVGGVDVELGIEYRCERCGSRFHDLPRTPEGLSLLVTHAIENLL